MTPHPVPPRQPTPLLDELAGASDADRAGLVAEWLDLVDLALEAGRMPVDTSPRNIVRDADGRLHFRDEIVGGPPGDRAEEHARALLWGAHQLAREPRPPFGAPVRANFELLAQGVAGVDQELLDRTLRLEAARLHGILPWSLDPDENERELRRLTNDPADAAVRLPDDEEESPVTVDEVVARFEERERASADERRRLADEFDRISHENHLAHLELGALQQSRAVRAVLAARRRLDVVAPWGTHRRGLVERGFRLLRRMPRARPRIAPPLSLTFPAVDTPAVTIVIPVHGKWEYTARCLESLHRHADGPTFEIVVVDDASPDDSRQRLEQIEGIRVVALDENVGFTRAANAGWRAARGTSVVMLNNDTEVTEGWLAELVRTAEEEPRAGIVGARLLYPGGRLQEAGGIVFQDASGWNYGRGDDPESPRYTFRRDVDYCSGAAILLTPALLAQVDGFDEGYAPAYYEDTDLAFTARRLGLRVVYEPRSVVVHHEGISNGTDEAVGMKAYQAANRVRFAEKWAVELAGQFPADPAVVTRASARRSPSGTVVVIDHLVPEWREDSGSVRMTRILHALRDLGYDVLFVPDNRHRTEPYTRELQARGIQVWYGHDDIWGPLRELEPEIAAVIISRASVAGSFLRHVREVLPEVPVIFDTVDLHFLREERRLRLPARVAEQRAALATRELELALIRSVDATAVVSDFEAHLLSTIVPEAAVRVLSNVHDGVPATDDSVPRTDIVFVGSFQHDPNADAVRWLVTEIFPLVLRERPDAQLVVVGRNPPADLVAAAPGSVRFLGWVDDLEPIHARTAVSVAPLRYGAGVKGKVGDAWAHGLAVVMTRLAAEGMHVEGGVTALVADDTAGFAEAIVAVLGDADLRRTLGEAARRHVEERFGSVRVRESLVDVLEAAGARAPAAIPRPESRSAT